MVPGIVLGLVVVPGVVQGWVVAPGFVFGWVVVLGLAGGGVPDTRENSAEELRHQIMMEQATMSRETIREITKPMPCFTGAVVNVSGGHGQR